MEDIYLFFKFTAPLDNRMLKVSNFLYTFMVSLSGSNDILIIIQKVYQKSFKCLIHQSHVYALEACRLNCLGSKRFVFCYVGCNTAPLLKYLTGSANQTQSQYFQSKSEIHSVVSHSLRPHGLYHLWNSPGQNTGVGSLSFLQGIFPIRN